MNYTLFNEIDSTNSYLKREEQVGEGEIIAAKTQTAGRGRRGNVWDSNEGGAWFSFVLETNPSVPQELYGKLPFLACEAVINILTDISGKDIFLFKWVNDVYVNGKKIAGILIEKSGARFIVGIGINVNNVLNEQFGLQRESLINIINKKVDTKEICIRVAERFYENYYSLLRGGWDEIYSVVSERNFLIGRRIEVVDEQNITKGIAEGITKEGKLLVKNEDGVYEIESGTVRFL